MVNNMLGEKIINAFLLAFFLLFVTCVMYKIANGQQTLAYYECDNLINTYVEFTAPDTDEKRNRAINLFGCYPIPQTFFNVPMNATVFQLVEKKSRIEIKSSFQSKFFGIKDVYQPRHK